MVQFTRLRLSGFKSFVEKTELEIGPGLNGIVGPNGCGKSNLVEALRWLMGESSAKRMRGDGMEDVIFAGTDQRSSRNIAEVSIVLDNSQRKAPSIYNNLEEIEIIRRIERDHGSAYKINGKNARARDVQMLFADALTGANSPALVSQGHVTRMINAKPQDRRAILEESAGIAGLYVRRQEAEQRLKAADTNLIRVDDILGSMENRLSNLKRQSRQAARYRNISGQIRQMDLIITYLEWDILRTKCNASRGLFEQLESIVAENITTVTQLTKTQTTQSTELPSLRKKEMELSAALQAQKLTFHRLEDEENRKSDLLKETKTLLEQTKNDLKHETQTFEDTSKILERIQEEEKQIHALRTDEEQIYEHKKQEKETADEKVKQLEEQYTALKESAAETRTRQAAFEKQMQQNQSRLTLLTERMNKAQKDRSNLEVGTENEEQIKKLERKIIELDTKRENLSSQINPSRENIKTKETAVENARALYASSERKRTEFSAEISMLEKIFTSDTSQTFIPVLNQIQVSSGFEKALSRALGDALIASLDQKAPSYWSQSPAPAISSSLPSEAKAILPFVNAPTELSRALSQIGFVENEIIGDTLWQKLLPGQSLVSAEGTYWRWDGFTVRSVATDRHSQYLEQKNRLLQLQASQIAIEEENQKAKSDLEIAVKELAQARTFSEKIVDELREVEKELSIARPAIIRIKEKITGIENEKARLTEIIKTVSDDIDALSEAIRADKVLLEALVQNQKEHGIQDIQQITQDLTNAKSIYQDAVRNLDLFIQQQNTRKARLQAIADERISLQNRSIRAREQLKNFGARKESLETKLAELQTQPKEQGIDKEALLSRIADMEKERTYAANKLAECEAEVETTSKALKEAEKILGDAREKRAHALATHSAQKDQFEELERSIEARLEIRPCDLVQHAAVDMMNYQHGDIENLKKQQDKNIKDRDSMGPVNLQADEEATSLEKEFSQLIHEKNDLVLAIEELRGGIQKINKEARARLSAAFEHVNMHFQTLFVRLFGGGKAHLALIESDDPLNAGLEIFAQPPGKALQSLSLLSGGEQTLTSIALIFAMFLTNPSPICVLDEIDAPLDDANVDRVCDLLEEIAERGETRFLIITHHRLTMARMDRLYGVTMSEKGVSQLVSVDLQRSFEFTDRKVA